MRHTATHAPSNQVGPSPPDNNYLNTPSVHFGPQGAHACGRAVVWTGSQEVQYLASNHPLGWLPTSCSTCGAAFLWVACMPSHVFTSARGQRSKRHRGQTRLLIGRELGEALVCLHLEVQAASDLVVLALHCVDDLVNLARTHAQLRELRPQILQPPSTSQANAL